MCRFLVSLIIVATMFMAGCGEAIFFNDIRLSENGSGADLNQIFFSTASGLGYTSCENGETRYCNKKTGHSFEVSSRSRTEFEITFGSFGTPNQQENARENLSAALKKSCSECQIYVKDRSVWGFRKEDTGWKPF